MMSVFSQRLTLMREKANYNKTKMANMVGVGLSTYANWEYGYNEPDMDMLIKLASVLGTTTDYLTGKSNNAYPSESPTKKIDDHNIDKVLDNVESFDGKPMTPHDRDVIKAYLQGYFRNK